MTGGTDVQPDDTLKWTNSLILIDGWPDGYVEERAWVEITTEVASSDDAIKCLERYYPVGDLDDGMHYFCDGLQEWMAPDGPRVAEELGCDPDEVPWHPADESVKDAKLFWVVEVEDDE